MSRRRRVRPLGSATVVDIEDGPDGRWYVRRVTGATATKAYRCPGCQQLLLPATPHVVAWPADDDAAGAGGDAQVSTGAAQLSGGGLEARRHWHAACWRARGRRRPTW